MTLSLFKLKHGMLIRGYISGAVAVFLQINSYYFEGVKVFNLRKQKIEYWCGPNYYILK